MAKQLSDRKTFELPGLPVPKRRGRPPSEAGPMSSAERQQLWRARQVEKVRRSGALKPEDFEQFAIELARLEELIDLADENSLHPVAVHSLAQAFHCVHRIKTLFIERCSTAR